MKKIIFIALLVSMAEILSAACAVTYVMNGDTFGTIFPNTCASYTFGPKVIDFFDFLKENTPNDRSGRMLLSQKGIFRCYLDESDNVVVVNTITWDETEVLNLKNVPYKFPNALSVRIGDNKVYVGFIDIRTLLKDNTGAVEGYQVLLSMNLNSLNLLDPKIVAFPNPAKDEFWLSLGETSYNTSNTEVFVFNVDGKLIKKIPIEDVVSKIRMEGVDGGIYFIQIVSDGQMVGKVRLIKE